MEQSKRRPIIDIEYSITPHNGNITSTYDEQDEVEEQILDIYRNFNEKHESDLDQSQAPVLMREKHISYLKRGLFKLSPEFEALDCSQPWLTYWILHSLNLLNSPLTPSEQELVISFLNSCQCSDGGFGGGPSQMPHVAATYAAVNAAICLQNEGALQMINREKLGQFILSMKVQSGAFRMHYGGEVDVRAVYCALVVTKLLKLKEPPGLFEGTHEWLLRCQTYEGGFGAYPGMEAHGGNTFCAVAALILLGKEKLMNYDSLLKWLAFKQMPLEGGFSGRTNKLVDCCYSFWQGSLFVLLNEAFGRSFSTSGGNWLFHQIALQEYVLICCQHHLGGLIDKPGKPRDFYHTCYSLSGLSIAQNSAGSKIVLGKPENLLRPLHPLFNLTLDSVRKVQKYFQNDSSVEVIQDEVKGQTQN